MKYYFGIDFGTTNSATVGYVVMDQKPFNMVTKKAGRFLPLLQSIKTQAKFLLDEMLGIKRWN